MIDYYKLLKISRDASQEEIKRAFKKEALKCHPDRAPEDLRKEYTELFKQLNHAYCILSDPITRQEYDNKNTKSETSSGDTSYRSSSRSYNDESFSYSETFKKKQEYADNFSHKYEENFAAFEKWCADFLGGSELYHQRTKEEKNKAELKSGCLIFVLIAIGLALFAIASIIATISTSLPRPIRMGPGVNIGGGILLFFILYVVYNIFTSKDEFIGVGGVVKGFFKVLGILVLILIVFGILANM